jgi:hypothetical protein
MAIRAQSDQILFAVVARIAPRLDVMDLQVDSRSVGIANHYAAGSPGAATDRAQKGDVLSCDWLTMMVTSLMLRNSNLRCSLLSQKCEEQENVSPKKRYLHRVSSINIYFLVGLRATQIKLNGLLDRD